MKARPVTLAKDTTDGRPYVLVPIGKTTYEALVDLEDWERLIALGYSGNLWSIRNGGPVYPIIYGPTTKDQTKRKNVTLVRAILGALSPEERVYYKSENRLDCRRKNLEVRTINLKQAA